MRQTRPIHSFYNPGAAIPTDPAVEANARIGSRMLLEAYARYYEKHHAAALPIGEIIKPIVQHVVDTTLRGDQ